MIHKEGKALFKLPPNVFYNPVQEFNRDLSISLIRHFLEEYRNPNATIFEGLAATGLRSIRYMKEISGIKKAIINDIDPEAVKIIRENIELNELTTSHSSEPLFEVTNGDAIFILHSLKERGIRPYVIDLDPYGSAVPFLDAAVQTIQDGGLLCVTCTDLAVLCANHPETCLAKYGGIPMKGKICHESAVRLVLNAIETSANRYKRHIVPLLSCSIDFYVRVFVRVFTSAQEVKSSACRRGHIIRCKQCRSYDCWPLLKRDGSKFSAKTAEISSCPLCGGHVQIFGPMWLGEMHKPSFLTGMIEKLKSVENHEFQTGERILGLLSLCSEEVDLPFFLDLSEMASFLGFSVPPLVDIRSAILNSAYKLSGSHTEPLAIKTNAPLSHIWKAVIAKCKGNNTPTEDSPQGRILQMAQSLLWTPSFELHSEAIPPSKSSKLKRFPENPTKNWGPISRPKHSKK